MNKLDRTDRVVLLSTLGLLCGPVLVDLAVDWQATPLRYFVADTFYYLVVGRNWANTGVFSFDQTHPANGFHPMWQLFTALIYKTGHALTLSDHVCLVLVLLLSIGLVAVGTILIALALREHLGRIPAAFLALPVGAYALMLVPVWLVDAGRGLHSTLEGPLPLHGTLWNFMNGMESGLTIACFGALAVCVRASASRRLVPAFLLGLSASLLTLARLDHALIAVAVMAVHGLSSLRNRRAAQMAVFTTAVFIFPLATYAAYNAMHFGSIVPLSGVAKSTFPSPHLQNLRLLLVVLRYPFGDDAWLDRFYRLAQLIVPALAAAGCWLAYGKRGRLAFPELYSGSDRESRFDLLLLGTGAGVAALSTYDFFFVVPGGIGSWYCPVSILYVSICVLVASADRLPKWSFVGFGMPVSLACLAVFIGLHRRAGYHERYVRFYLDEAPRVKEHYGAVRPNIVEYDDGIVAYATGFPALSGTGLMLDRQAYEALAAGRFVALALDRGFDRATSLVYLNFATQDLAHFDRYGISSALYPVSLDYRSGDGTFGIIRFGDAKKIQ